MERAAMTDKKFGALRRRARRLGAGRTRRYPAKLRAEVLSAVTAPRAAGWSWERLSDELDISIETLRRLWQDEQRGDRPALAPVEVVTELGGVSGDISVMTPAGFRVDGLGVDDAVRLIRALS